MIEDRYAGSIFMFGLMFGLLLGTALEYYVQASRYQRQAIQHNAGQYNPTTGKFEWLDNECR
jgi:hypothetical protein